MKLILILLFPLGLLADFLPDAYLFFTHDFSATSVTSGTYVQVDSGTGVTCDIKKICVTTTNGNSVYLAQGAASSEAKVQLIPAGGTDGCQVVRIPNAARISLKALNTTLSTGVLVMNAYCKAGAIE